MKTLIVRTLSIEGFFVWLKKELIFVEFKNVQPCLQTRLAFKCGYGLVPFEDVTMVTDMERHLMRGSPACRAHYDDRYGDFLESAVYGDLPDTMGLLYLYLCETTQRERELTLQVYDLEQKLQKAKEFLDKTFVLDREALFINPGNNVPMVKAPSPVRKSPQQIQEILDKEKV